MATITSGSLTLADLAKRMNNNNMLAIAEVLSEENEVLRDAIHVEANGTTIHTFNQRKSEPTIGWRAINEGTAVGKSYVTQEEEGMGMLEAWSQVDAKLVDLAPDKAAFRSDEDLAFVSAIGKQFADDFIHGNLATTPKGIKGLANRYNATSMANVESAAGTSVRTSIYIVQWGKTKAHLIYPMGSKIGLQIDDKGKQVVLDGDKNPYDAYRTKFTFDTGVVVHDDRCVQRICNIKSTDLFSTSLIDNFIIKALNRMPNRGAGASIYMNSNLISQFDIQAKDKTNVNYGTKNIWGEDVTTFKTRPIRMIDKITDAEDAVS